jgi:hypothetical protein
LGRAVPGHRLGRGVPGHRSARAVAGDGEQVARAVAGDGVQDRVLASREGSGTEEARAAEAAQAAQAAERARVEEARAEEVRVEEVRVEEVRVEEEARAESVHTLEGLHTRGGGEASPRGNWVYSRSEQPGSGRDVPLGLYAWPKLLAGLYGGLFEVRKGELGHSGRWRVTVTCVPDGASITLDRERRDMAELRAAAAAWPTMTSPDGTSYRVPPEALDSLTRFGYRTA